ncbi:MAG: mevalonate kinase [Thermoplasmata archaeon]
MESTAPAKIILFGEHAVVYGEPAIAMAISIRSTVKINRAEKFLINGEVPDSKFHSYIKKAIELYWKEGPLNVTTKSMIPHASGLGSSASITVSTVSSILALQNDWSKEKIAKDSFEVEYLVQGTASPTDTSTVTSGGVVLVSRHKPTALLWEIEKEGNRWYLNNIDISQLSLVIGCSSIKGITHEQVEKVRRYVNNSSFAREVIKEIGDITVSSIPALKNGDYETLGNLMKKNQKLLSILGVSIPKIQNMINEVEKYSYGAKITGAGGGGCIIVLTDEKDEVSKILKDGGWEAYLVKMDKEGVKAY